MHFFFLLTSLDSARSRDHPPKELRLLGENPSTRLSECIHMTSRRQYSCSKTVSIRSHRPQPLSPLMKCTQWNGGHIGVGLLGFFFSSHKFACMLVTWVNTLYTKNVKFGRAFLTTNEEFRYAKSPNFTNVKNGCCGAVRLYFVREGHVQRAWAILNASV